MEKISDRVKKIIDTEALSIRSVESDIDCSNGVLAKFIRMGTDISSHWMSKIIDRFSDYDARWIMTGKGDMKQNTPTDHKTINQEDNTVKVLLERYEDMVFENRILKQENEHLKLRNKYHASLVHDIAAEPDIPITKPEKNS